MPPFCLAEQVAGSRVRATGTVEVYLWETANSLLAQGKGSAGPLFISSHSFTTLS